MNLGLRCTMSCRHCHHRCSPERTEQITDATLDRFLAFAEGLHPALVDITGGAPELHPRLRDVVRRLREADVEVQVRTNLAVLLEPECEDLPAFFAENRVRLLASLPAASPDAYALQRDASAFDAAIEAMRRLNHRGYALSSDLVLDVAVNPISDSTDCSPAAVGERMRSELILRLGVVFRDVVVIANMPLGRYAEQLIERNELEDFVSGLERRFNPSTLPRLACRSTLEVAWDGSFSDCDFNLSAGLGLAADAAAPIDGTGDATAPFVPLSLADLDRFDSLGAAVEVLARRRINYGDHCLACTADAGSS